MRLALSLAALTLAAGTAARAQLPSMGALGGMGGLAPDVSSVGAGNAAGVIGYCVKNKYLGEGSMAGSVMSRLKGQGATQNPGYAAGQGGMLQMGGGSTFSMDSLKGKIKTKVCDMVLTHAQSLSGLGGASGLMPRG